jgi:2-polyprenyl-3-methyl-5-hydroxy-6-metoxy-1,4-benzoquinol methylase
MSTVKQFTYTSAAPAHTTRYLLPVVIQLAGNLGPGTRVLDVGCGNGHIAGHFLERGCHVVGLDLGEAGIQIARKTFPKGRFEVLAADERVLENLGELPFDLVVSTEVVEHLYDPRAYAKGCYAACKPGGRFICSTPYHGYLKNLALSLMGKWDQHANPLWDGGHIKLWSRATLSELLRETGFRDIRFRGAGRVPLLWMSMVLAATRPQGT